MRLKGKIHLLKLDFEINVNSQKKIERFVNSIIVFGDQITLIDTGVKGSFVKIFDYIKANQRKVSEIATIILSHSHPDHIGSAYEIKNLTGCRILAHPSEKIWIEDIASQAKERPVPGFLNLVDRSVKIDEFLQHNQELKAEQNITMQIIHSPGHSKGSLNILFKEDKILFTADSIPLINDIPNYDNFHDLLKSLNYIKNNKDYDTLLTSWTPPLTNKKEIDKILTEGENYCHRLNETVGEIYSGLESYPLEFCTKAISTLSLPDFYAMPIVDRAFRSHNK